MALEVEYNEFAKNLHRNHPEDSLYILLCGTSESGKSEFGRQFNESGLANRVKYLRVAAELSEEEGGNGKPMEYLNAQSETLQNERDVKIWQRIDTLTREHSSVSIIETIKHPHFIHAFGQAGLQASTLTIYIDALFESRLTREAHRLGVSAEEYRDYIIKKDDNRQKLQNEPLKDLADLTVQNDGTYEEYIAWITQLQQQVLKEYPVDINVDKLLYE